MPLSSLYVQHIFYTIKQNLGSLYSIGLSSDENTLHAANMYILIDISD